MGQHKIPGASLGPDYYKNQHPVSRFTKKYIPGKHNEGKTFKMQDGREYIVDKSGSFRRI